jgi:zinc-binding alcohol dehydrogenase/oxidoreductase
LIKIKTNHKRMKALVLVAKDQPLMYETLEKPQNTEGYALVELKAAALNHRDVWILKGMYGGIKYPSVLGSDGAGILEDGTEVIINPSLDWGDDARAQGKNFRILGLPDEGTFAQYIKIPKSNIVAKPPHLTFEEAAAVPLAGLTAYRALFTKCQPLASDKILISGIGGGVALFALQFAVAAGFEVWVTSSSVEKIEKAKALGAKGGYNYKEEGWSKKAMTDMGGFDCIIDGAVGTGFSELVKSCRPAARICFYGGTAGGLTGVSPQIIFYKQIVIMGSTMGTADEFAAMITLINEHKIVPVVDSVYDLKEGNAALQRMDEGGQFGKIVLAIA